MRESDLPNSSDMVLDADCAMSVSSLLIVEMMEEAGDDRSESRSDVVVWKSRITYKIHLKYLQQTQTTTFNHIASTGVFAAM